MLDVKVVIKRQSLKIKFHLRFGANWRKMKRVVYLDKESVNGFFLIRASRMGLKRRGRESCVILISCFLGWFFSQQLPEPINFLFVVEM